MNRLNSAGVGLLVLMAASAAQAGAVEDLSANLTGRTGKASVDHRQKETVLRVFGKDIEGGCKGDVQSALVRITGATGTLKGDTAAMDVTYEGEYDKDACGSGQSASEKKRLFGHYVFQVTSKPFQKLAVSAGDLAPGFGEIADRDHVSNRLAAEAVRNAVASAF